jgi:hypothetical protein
MFLKIFGQIDGYFLHIDLGIFLQNPLQSTTLADISSLPESFSFMPTGKLRLTQKTE